MRLVFKLFNVCTIFQVSKKRAAELMLDRLKQLPPVASAMVPKPRKVVTGKKKSRNLIKVRERVVIGRDRSRDLNIRL